MVRATVALDRDARLRPGEVESVASLINDDPVLTNGRRE
jgi:hypothetical protein